MSVQLELQKQFRQGQEKYVYYVLGLTVASIGFSVHQTSESLLSFSQIPLAIAILCWVFSIYFVRFVKIILAVLYKNNEMLNIEEGRNAIVGDDPVKIKYGMEIMVQIMEKDGDKSSRLFKFQTRLFFVGVIFFIIWRILEMYLASLIN